MVSLMMPSSPLRIRFLPIVTAALLLAVVAAPSHAQEKIVTGVEMSENAMKHFEKREEFDAKSIIGMLNEGVFALECASPKKMRAIVMFLTDDRVMRVEGEPVELKPGRHAAKGVMPGDNVSDVWTEMTGGKSMEPDSADAHYPDSVFHSEEEIADAMRDRMEIGDGRVGLVLFLTVAEKAMAEEMGEALQIRPMGLVFNAGNAGN